MNTGHSFNIRVMELVKNQNGLANILLLPLIISVVLLVSTIGFAAWAFSSRQDYKNNVDQKIATAVELNTKQVSDKKDNEFLEKEKFPLDNFQGNDQFGAIKVNYPKTWSAYISENDSGAQYIFDPKFVNADQNTSHALRITVESTAYSDAVTFYDSQLLEGELSAKAYSLPRVKNVVGTRFDGTFEEGKQGTVIILPLRDKSIKIYNEVPGLVNDFNNIILENFSFNP